MILLLKQLKTLGVTQSSIGSKRLKLKQMRYRRALDGHPDPGG
jgi:hypothetical protein